jgi:hypothetical protein
MGCFNSHLVDSRKLEASTPTRHGELDEFIDNLDELLLPDLIRQIEKMFVFDVTSTRTAPELVGSDSNRFEGTTQSKFPSDLEEDLDCFLKLEDMGPPFSTTTRTPTKSTRHLVLHLQARAEEDLKMREPLLLGAPLLLTTTCNPMTTPNPFRVVT